MKQTGAQDEPPQAQSTNGALIAMQCDEGKHMPLKGRQRLRGHNAFIDITKPHMAIIVGGLFGHGQQHKSPSFYLDYIIGGA